MVRFAVILSLLALPVAAQEIVSPSEFREYAEGYTLHFEQNGQPFGLEEFQEGGRTVWQFRDGTCAEGAWRAHGAQVCFYYGDNEDVLCWRVLRDREGLLARLLTSEDEGLELRITRREKSPVLCSGSGANL